MPHDGPIDLVREHPDLALDLIRTCPGVKLPRNPKTSLAPTDMSAAVPVQFLADMVVLVSDGATKKPVLAVVIEPQLRDRDTKRFSWPVYVATARRVNKCPMAVLVVICPDPAEASKCRRVIRTGHPGFDLAPVVIDSSSPPGGGGENPYITVFAAAIGAIDMTDEKGARRVLDALAAAPVEVPGRRRMTAIILTVAPEVARLTLEALMHTAEYEKTFVDKIHDQGMAEGKAEGKAEDLLQLLDVRGIALTDEQRGQVTSCTDSGQLSRWFVRAITANAAAEVFAD
jgi:hypothetical protein